MMSYRKHLTLSLFWITALPLLAQSTGSPSTPTGTSQAGSQQSKSTTTTAHVAHQRDGQAVFDQNCSRCHTAPQGFSPNISGSIIRHMRVRASLSKEDEQALLRFLNP